MQLAKVVGSVVSTQKSPSLIGKKLLIIRPIRGDGSFPEDAHLSDEIAVDSVGAGEGELVFVTRGSSARLAIDGMGDAVDAAIVGIVDSLTYQEDV
ncbi:EutN/CcmL family microcompartment protein [Vibrio sp. HN007]|uniref:EutN/CcmL family microcompartment protein n=1 Tax=Vibrio iocasae TaxID=3098914 RepID=UPI0035D4BF57